MLKSIFLDLLDFGKLLQLLHADSARKTFSPC